MSPPKQFSLLLLSVFCACNEPAPKREWTPADHGQTEQGALATQEPNEAAQSAEDATARAARALWIATCASCHGRDGRGDGEARPPGAQLPDFATPAFQQGRSDSQLAQVIRDGRGMMPAFGKRVNDQGIAVLVQHIRTFDPTAQSAPEAAHAEPPAPQHF